jgi:adenylate cyclase
VEGEVAGERAERKLTAIFAGDIAGYSRLMGADEVGTLAALKAHRAEAIDPKLARHNGRIVKTTGDGILIEFSSVVDAVQCAVEIQDDMRARNAAVPQEKRIEFRIGINVGDVIIEGGDVFGDGVNIAARLEQLAEPGGICVSRAAYEQVRDKLAFKFQDCGAQTVKNIARPIRVYRFAAEGALPMHPATAPGSRRRVATLAAAALSIAALAIGAWFALPIFTSMGADRPPSLGTPRLSIAVLPFANLSGDKDQDYFADALTEDLTADLSRISGSFVIARSTAATYEGQTADPKRIARELGVRYLLEGNVRKAGSDVRVTVQLIEGASGQQLWTERYQKTTGDIHSFQNEVTGRVARALDLELKDAVSRRAARGASGNMDAQDYALRAWAELWAKPQSKATNDAALDYSAKALALDPNNSDALGAASYAHARASVFGWSASRAESIRLGLQTGEKSIALDPKNTDAWYALGFLYRNNGEYSKALEYFRQCLALNRNHAPSYFQYGLILLFTGRPKDAVEWIDRAFVLSPRDPLRAIWHGALARALMALGDDAKAVESLHRGIAANPDFPMNYAILAAALAQQGRQAEAKAALAEFTRRQPGMSIARFRTVIGANEARAEKTLERIWSGLRKAGLPD